MSYETRYQQLTDLHGAADPLLGTDRDSWRDARRAAVLTVLLDAAGERTLTDPDPAPQRQLVADLLERLDTPLRDTVVWLAETCDTSTVAGVAALLDRARQSAGSTPAGS